jgi:hypothetical protein
MEGYQQMYDMPQDAEPTAAQWVVPNPEFWRALTVTPEPARMEQTP